MPADLLLFALIAAGLIFWLRNILGTRDDDDLPAQPHRFSDNDENSTPPPMKKKSDSGKVVSLNANIGDGYALPNHVSIDNKTTENALDDIRRDEPNFDLGHFAQGAEGAFSMIIEAFAEGDLNTLQDLLAPEVYEAFETAIAERKLRGEKVETQIQNIEKIDITEAQIKGDHLFITVRFSANEICVIRDKEDNILSGDPEKTTSMADVWVFGRELASDTPEWYLYETRDDEIEEHKTPIPEGGSDKEKK